MPNFRLNDDSQGLSPPTSGSRRLAISLPSHSRKRAHGKELFETRGLLACHSIGEGDHMQGGTFAANLTPRRRKGQLRYLVRWVHNPRERTRPYWPLERRTSVPKT